MMRLKLGTRGSKLALWQAQAVTERLKEYHPDLQIEVVIIKTAGDKILDVALSRIGDKGLFTKELEKALLDGTIDLAVHSLKDLPSQLGEGLKLAAVMPRENPGDVLISRSGLHLSDLPAGSVIGTSSLRRTAQLKAVRPDLQVIDIRGNVETRIKKMQEQQLDGIILAYAGVKRLGLEHWITQVLPYDIMLPATGQGTIAIETRDHDEKMDSILETVNDRKTFAEIQAERAFLGRLEGGCQVPMACLAECREGVIHMQGLVSSLDGSRVIRDSITGSSHEPEQIGLNLAERILEAGADRILRSIQSMGDQ
ncbi:MAG TPA: hydroxymethylbilane synthase [Syntrophomonadaceae bacterium]|nr:hydroxymethylbilane synthase [Syntrophomonadaceae bacterium]HOQ08808.1 hydroxymethylbilane synthase [Syntrophomonadaceae bacterium]HPU47772.1 hydroxymethylbilane synthase [Syntrophomonadaceae bacterium]